MINNAIVYLSEIVAFAGSKVVELAQSTGQVVTELVNYLVK